MTQTQIDILLAMQRGFAWKAMFFEGKLMCAESEERKQRYARRITGLNREHDRLTNKINRISNFLYGCDWEIAAANYSTRIRIKRTWDMVKTRGLGIKRKQRLT